MRKKSKNLRDRPFRHEADAIRRRGDQERTRRDPERHPRSFQHSRATKEFRVMSFILRVGAEKIEKSTRSAISLQRGRVWASLTRQIVANGLRYTCAYVAPAPHTGIPTHRVSRRDPPTSRFRRGPPERLLVDSGIQKCHGCVGDPRLTPKMRGSTHVPRADGDPQLSIGDPGTTFHHVVRGRSA